jgi:hypothetical protein
MAAGVCMAVLLQAFVSGAYRPPLPMIMPACVFPLQMIISSPVHTAVNPDLAVGQGAAVGVVAHVLVDG